MNFKRFNGSTWETVQHKIYGSGTDQLVSFPAVIQASGDPLTDYTIYGNTIQSGVPTPSAPIYPHECGDKTENLTNAAIEQGSFNVSTGEGISSTSRVRTVFSDAPLNSGTYTIAVNSNTVSQIVVYVYDSNKSYKSAESETVWQNSPVTFTLVGERYVRFAFRNENNIDVDPSAIESIMLNTGSTDLPYEPYGYKLPITVNGTEYPIYLGQVETTRRIKKLVLTGAESWTLYNGNYYSSVTDRYSLQNMPCRCTHTAGGILIDNGSVRLKVFASRFTTVASNLEEWKSYLAAQYAAGTPVTVWYVLAEAETGIVNEPLHKIGGYADTISFAQAGVTIQTSDGDSTITFGTTVKPSAMSATFKGWHPVQGAKVYDGNDWS